MLSDEMISSVPSEGRIRRTETGSEIIGWT